MANLDFSQINAVAIPDGDVVKIEINGTLVWKAVTYKNWVRYSIDTDGSIFNNGLGYQNNQELSGSSGSQRAGSGTTVTGFIPVKQGDVIRIKGCGWYSTAKTNYIVAYTSDFKHWGSTQTTGGHYYNSTNNPTNAAIERPECGGSMDIQSDVSTIVIAKNKGSWDDFEKIAYIRISVRGDGVTPVDGAKLIVTVNEEIT